MRKEGYDSGNDAPANIRIKKRIIPLFLYNILLSLYVLAIRLYALFNAKAGKWIAGRRNWQQHLNDTLQKEEKRIWIHCSSLGEFEQAKPVIEALKQQFPLYKTVVTFFSPSGYEACKKSGIVDYIFYLPLDTKRNAQQFVAAIDPALAMFVKYEFWYYYLRQLQKDKIPTLLVSGAFREGQVFFMWYGGLFRDMLLCFSAFFLQDERSKELLRKIGIDKNVLVSGDTRYDRVGAIAKNITPIPAIEHFKAGHKILIAGSTWPGDEEVLKECLPTLPANWKLIIAPHEIDAAHIKKIQQLFANEPVLFSALNAENTGYDKRILIINNIGMLSRLFACGDIAFIGGGFQKGGIHNILEPAVFGLPVIFGPVYEKFVEAVKLVSLHYVFPVNNAAECKAVLNKLISDEAYRGEIRNALKTFMQQHTGATQAIMDEIGREQWLG